MSFVFKTKKERENMRNSIKLLGALLLFTISISAGTHSKKTFLMPRSSGVNIAMEKAHWHDHFLNKKENNFRSNYQEMFFHQAGIKGEDVGKYFGINGKNTFTVGAPATSDINNRYIIHSQAASTLAGEITFNPKQEVYGIRLDFMHETNHPFKKTFIKASLPVVHVENDMHLKIGNQVAQANDYYLKDFFEGKELTSLANTNKQAALTHGKIGSRRTTTGIADIDLALGYKLLQSENHHLFFNTGVTIATGTRPTGEHLFEPVYGNGNHFGVGFGIDASQKLWKRSRHSGKLVFATNYKYLFEGSEKRTIGINSITYPFAHYYGLGEVGKPADTALIPAANILTRDVKVRPGSQIDSMLALSFKSSRFIIDVGYNLFIKKGESVSVRSWEDAKYAIAKDDFDVTGQFIRTDANKAADITANTLLGKTLDIGDLNVSAASTPSYLTHKAFGSIGYNFNLSKYPSSIAFGGSYEFASSNHELEGYAFWCKGAISF